MRRVVDESHHEIGGECDVCDYITTKKVEAELERDVALADSAAARAALEAAVERVDELLVLVAWLAEQLRAKEAH